MTSKYLDKTSQYPQNGIINCIITEQNTENDFVNINTSNSYAIYSEDEQTKFTVKKSLIINE